MYAENAVEDSEPWLINAWCEILSGGGKHFAHCLVKEVKSKENIF